MSKKNGFSAKWLEKALKENPHLSADYNGAREIKEEVTRENHPDTTRIQNTESKPTKRKALERETPGAQEVPKSIIGRIRLCITGFRVRPLDPDNHIAGCKAIIDQLRYSGLIPEDNPWTIRLEGEQVKVRSFKDEKTVIEIEYPEELTPQLHDQSANIR